MPIIPNNGLGTGGGSSSNTGLLKIQKFSTSGTYAPTSGTKEAVIYITGGGGAGGGVASGLNKGAGGGGAAGCTVAALVKIDDTLTGTVTIGPGGTGVTGANGNNGNDSTFSFNTALVTANGGAGGSLGGNDGGERFTGSADLANGSVSGDDVQLLHLSQGIHGSIAIYQSAGNTASSGSGGSSIYGGAGDYRFSNGTSLNNNGFSAQPNTGSGGGGGLKTNSTAVKGGDGSEGFCLIYEYADNVSAAEILQYSSQDLEYNGNLLTYGA